MNFDWRLYLQLANELSGRAEEFARRTAVSRAYYSAYHIANDFLNANGVATDTSRGSHERVWRVYIKSSRRECQDIGNYGFRLKNARIYADYHADRKVCPAQVQRCLQDAQRIINSVSLPGRLPEGFVAKRPNFMIRIAKCLMKCMKS